MHEHRTRPNHNVHGAYIMADNKVTHSQDLPTRQDFPEVKDKIVDIVELSAEPNHFGITIRFQDRTTLTFTIEPCVVAFPVYSDWTDGEENQLQRYQPILNKVPRL